MEGDGGYVQNTEEFTITPLRQHLQIALLGLLLSSGLVVVLSKISCSNVLLNTGTCDSCLKAYELLLSSLN